MTIRYRKYSEAMRERFGKKIYKIPIQLPVTCPNRDGRLSSGGCSFCGEAGAGFECLENTIPVLEQFQRNAAYIGKKYKAEGFVGYFQNYSNTYQPPELLEAQLQELVPAGVVGISLSTRPDCVSVPHLEAIRRVAEPNGWHVTLEYGLQTVNYHTLDRINRGHGLAEFLEAVLLTKRYGFETCAHMILNLPWDTDRDSDEGAAILGALGVEQVKVHALYLLRGTPLGKLYEEGQLPMISAEAYVERVVRFIRGVPPEMVFQRLTGRAPESETLFCNWGMSWWRLAEMIEARLEALDARQGDQCLRLGGKAVRQWL